MTKPCRGRYAIPRTFVACAPRLIDVDKKTRKKSLTRHSAFSWKF